MDSRPARILLAEDNPGDIFLVREAIQASHLEARLTVKKDGQETVAFLEAVDAGTEERPDLMLLDLNLPKYTGSVILERMRRSDCSAGIPVLIITSSDAPYDRELAARFGATGYFRKPNDLDEFMMLGELIRDILTQQPPV